MANMMTILRHAYRHWHEQKSSNTMKATSLVYSCVGVLLVASLATAFTIQVAPHPEQQYAIKKSEGFLFMSESDDNEDESEEEEIEPGMMRVSEIKAELEMRGIPYADCFDKESLAQRLKEARLSGISNPKLIDKFNKQRVSNRIYRSLTTDGCSLTVFGSFSSRTRSKEGNQWTKP